MSISRRAPVVIAVALLSCLGSGSSTEAGSGTLKYPSSIEPRRAGALPRTALETDIKQRHIGGYSYRPSDVTGDRGGARASIPGAAQSQGGPFDSDFFFDSGIGPHGGNSPYLH